MKIVYKSSNISEAHILHGMLSANGIESHVGGHYLQGGIGELLATDYAIIYVADSDVPSAKSIIAEYEGTALDLNNDEQEYAVKRAEVVERMNKIVFPKRAVMVILATLSILILYYLMTY